MVLPIIYHYKQQKQTLSVTYSFFFSLSETEVTGDLMAENTLLITPHTPPPPHVAPGGLPGSHRAALLFDLVYGMGIIHHQSRTPAEGWCNGPSSERWCLNVAIFSHKMSYLSY